MSQMGEEENEIIDTVFAEPVVIPGKTLRRFYEVIVLLLSLNECYRGTASKKSNDLPNSAGEGSDEHLFQNFVSRLGQICDSRPRGSTVTAFAVLQHPDKVEYIFGSNRRQPVELETTRAYIRAVISCLRESSHCEDDDQREKYLSNLLRDVLTFNRERIQRYLKGLTIDLEACIAICGTESSLISASRRESFARMLKLVQLANQSDNDDDEFLDHTEELIKALQSLQKPATALFIRKRASGDEAGNTEPWRNLQHRSSRLLAYRRAVETLWDSGSMWPSLFDAFEVTCIPSSIKAPNPLNAGPQTASEILTRMIPNSVETKSKYLDLAETMQQNFNLNKLIEDEWISNSFRPIIHAEILVHNWLEKTGGTRPERFFHNWQYIGCSKPVCKLCHYYFSIHPSGVQIRGTHGNLYRNWRMPDYADLYGLGTKNEALAKRHDILQGIASQLQQCVLRTLREKITDTRPCDSNTISSFGPNYGHIGMGIQDLNLAVSRTRLNSSIRTEPQFSEDWETMDGESDTRDGGARLLETETSSSAN